MIKYYYGRKTKVLTKEKSMLKKSLIAHSTPKANEKQVKTVDNVRITYLTSRLLRVEVGEFCDLASYAVWYRDFPAGELNVSKKGNSITAETEDIILTLKKKKPFSVFFKDTRKTELFSKQKTLRERTERLTRLTE